MNNSNLYEKLKSREKNSSQLKSETKATIPQFAKITTDKMLQCTICNEIVKNEVFWLKHYKSEKHIQGLKFLKESLTKREIVIQKTDETRKIPEISNMEKKPENLQNSPNIQNISDIPDKITPHTNKLINRCEDDFEQSEIIKNTPNDKIKSKVMKILQESEKQKELEKDFSSFVPEGFFDSPETVIQVFDKKSKIDEKKKIQERQKPFDDRELSVSLIMNEETIKEEESEEYLQREIEAMIECSEFIGNLIKKDKKKTKSGKEKNFQHVLQNDEMLCETIKIDEKLLNKKRKKVKFELDDDDNDEGKNIKNSEDLTQNIFDYNWRS